MFAFRKQPLPDETTSAARCSVPQMCMTKDDLLTPLLMLVPSGDDKSTINLHFPGGITSMGLM